jgi:N-acetylmuramoyl-L-alanine amidase
MIGNASARTASAGEDVRFAKDTNSAKAAVDTNAAEDAEPTGAVVRPAPHAPVLSDRDVVIAVDAGHGGKDPGAIGRSGTEEKNVTLAIARALAERIDEQPGMRAVLTRGNDVFLLLGDRVARAIAAHADLFVSVHADSIQDRTISGSSVYVLSEHGATSEAARVLAERENSADQLGGLPLAGKSPELKSVLIDLAQTASISASMTAAQGVLAALDHVGEVRKARVQQAGFVVLKSPVIPSMLVETAYISNPVDERRLRTAREQRKLADAIFAGLLGYFEQNPPSGTRFARLLNDHSNDASTPTLAAAPGAPPSGGQAAVPPTSRLSALETP